MRCGVAIIVIFGIYFIIAAYMAIQICYLKIPAKRVMFAGADMFTACACCVSGISIWAHLRHWVQPRLQVNAVRMILMVPIYSIESALALRAGKYAVIWETLRETYEAFAIYCFVRFLIAGLAFGASGDNGDGDLADTETQESLVIAAMAKKDSQCGQHYAGLQWVMDPWVMGEEFLVKVKLGTMSYVWTRLLCTALTLILEPLGKYDEGNLNNPRAGYLWCTLLLTISQSWALYVLCFLYHAMADELAPLLPFPKFVSVKAIVFFSFWQSILIVMLEKCNMIPSPHDAHDSSTFNSQELQDLIICYEMFAAAFAMHVAFPASQHCRGITEKAGGNTSMKEDKEVAQGDVKWWHWSELRKSILISASIISPEDVMRESEETAALLTDSLQVQGDIRVSIAARHDPTRLA